jgi:hypothetical protein
MTFASWSTPGTIPFEGGKGIFGEVSSCSRPGTIAKQGRWRLVEIRGRIYSELLAIDLELEE